MAGPFNLRSGIDLHVEAGAKLLANPDEKAYTKSAFRQNPGEGTIWIGGENIQNVSDQWIGRDRRQRYFLYGNRSWMIRTN